MSENTKISWATHSFSPWIGCAKVHTGCANCYAEAMAGRLGVTWGPNGTRRRTAESTWRQVERWNRKATCFWKTGSCSEGHIERCPQRDRPRVFPSLCDPFEDWSGHMLDKNGAMAWNENGGSMGIHDVRSDFFALIDRCPNLDFLLLTKRPENIRSMWRGCEDAAVNHNLLRNRPRWHRHNVWLIYSASDQQTLEARLPHLLACRDLVPVLGLSLEPLVGPVDLGQALVSKKGYFANVQQIECCGKVYPKRPGVDWVIVGGESGPRHRQMCPFWLRSIADQCSAAGVPLFVKQDCGPKAGQQGRIPDDVWAIKQFPKARAT